MNIALVTWLEYSKAGETSAQQQAKRLALPVGAAFSLSMHPDNAMLFLKFFNICLTVLLRSVQLVFH